jgi:hypothetical protein
VSGQLALIEVPAQPRLTPLQTLVLSLVETREGGVLADEAGAAAHGMRANRPHPITERCSWCETDGAAILHALARKELAHPVMVEGQFRYLAGPADMSNDRYGIFPDGY